MVIAAFLLLLVIIAYLSKADVITRHPLTRREINSVQSLVLQRTIAVMLMLPVIITLTIPLPSWVLLPLKAMWATAIIICLVPPLAWLIARSDKNDAQRVLYAPLRNMTLTQTMIYVMITSLYMILYEVLLRGILLNYLVQEYGMILAIVINALIYAAMHLAKNPREALLSIPLGILLCWMTLYTTSVWPATIFHLAMALSFEGFYSRKMRYGQATGSGQ